MRAGSVTVTLLALAPVVTGCAARQQFLDRIHAEKAARQGGAASATAPPAVASRPAPVTATPTEAQPDTAPVGAVPSAQPARDAPAPATSTPAEAASSAPAAASPVVATAATSDVPPGMQYLYGSAEAAAISRQSYMQLASFLLARQSDRQVGNPIYSVVLTPAATLAKPVYEDCGKKPLAIVLDVDETVLLNEGFEADQARNGNRYDPARWDAWEKTGMNAVVPVPGVTDALALARRAGIKVIFNTNRSAANAAGTSAAIEHAGLGPAVHNETLYLKGDVAPGDGKDARRWAISAKYCVIAMAGDQLGDFSDLFAAPGLSPLARRALVEGSGIGALWGQGWFVLPNPVYGNGLKGGMSDVFAPATQWAPGAAQEK